MVKSPTGSESVPGSLFSRLLPKSPLQRSKRAVLEWETQAGSFKEDEGIHDLKKLTIVQKPGLVLTSRF